MLDIRGLAKSFNDNTVLDHIDLNVAAGSTTAVVGASGCGKTTLLRLVAGFETPDAGTVTISDRQVASAERSVAPHRRGVGYVAQDGALFPHLTVGQNIAYACPAAHAAEKSATGWPSCSKPFHGSLIRVSSTSSALRRSAAARRARPCAGGEPVLMLLDEPFTALDTGLRASTRKAVAALLADAG